jgi:IS5 family transposase
MVSIKDHLTIVYVIMADFFDQHPAMAQWRHSNNNQPAFTDAEVIAIALMQSYFRTTSLKRTYLLVRANDPRAFPRCCSYPQWLARLNRLAPLLGLAVADMAQAHAPVTQFYLLDAQPIPVCQPIRHGRVRLLRDEGAYFGKTSKGWFFGFKLHLLVTASGLTINAILTPANWDDRDVVTALVQSVHGGSLCLGDRGYRRPALQDELLADDDVLLLTRADAGPEHQALLCSLRERVETTFSQLWQRLATRVSARSWQGLWTSLLLKLLDHSLCHVGLLPVSFNP